MDLTVCAIDFIRFCCTRNTDKHDYTTNTSEKNQDGARLNNNSRKQSKTKPQKVINTRCHVWPGCCADVGVMHGLCLLDCLPICPPLTLAVSLWQKNTHTYSDTAAFSHFQPLCRNEYLREGCGLCVECWVNCVLRSLLLYANGKIVVR